MAARAPGLYVHVPFCARACPYCDFDFEVAGSKRLPDRVEAWFAGLERERAARELSGPVTTVYLGGGTPSILSPAQFRRLFDWIDAHFDRRGAEEQTVEMNPEHVDGPRLDALADCGVDRVSLGVQALGSRGLQQLGRVHERDRALAAVAACVERFETSVDFILGWQGQRLRGDEALLDQLAQVQALGVRHLSLYALTIEEGSAWPGLVRRGLRADVDEDEQATLLEGAEAWLVEQGWEHYEVSSYAREGRLAVHNRSYWNSQDYWGLGPSASSASFVCVDGETRVRRRSNARGMDAWLAQDFGEADHEDLGGEAAAGEALWLALRQLGGVELGPFFERFGQVDRRWLEERISSQLARGNLEFTAEGRRLRVAPGRWAWHDSIAVDLVASSRDSR